jgi:hypothetical protein
VPDCNANGVLDECDADNNSNGTPDDCELCAGGAASGDANGDGNVDLDDLTRFEACIAGPEAGLSSGCECFDFDADGDNDLLDFAKFQIMFVEP